jgi:hypothetical protein
MGWVSLRKQRREILCAIWSYRNANANAYSNSDTYSYSNADPYSQSNAHTDTDAMHGQMYTHAETAAESTA